MASSPNLSAATLAPDSEIAIAGGDRFLMLSDSWNAFDELAPVFAQIRGRGRRGRHLHLRSHSGALSARLPRSDGAALSRLAAQGAPRERQFPRDFANRRRRTRRLCRRAGAAASSRPQDRLVSLRLRSCAARRRRAARQNPKRRSPAMRRSFSPSARSNRARASASRFAPVKTSGRVAATSGSSSSAGAAGSKKRCRAKFSNIRNSAVGCSGSTTRTTTSLSFLYDHAAALIFPSYAEGFGLPIVEAARRGRPVICSDIPVFREVGRAGALYFRVNDAKALAETIADFLDGRRCRRPGPGLARRLARRRAAHRRGHRARGVEPAPAVACWFALHHENAGFPRSLKAC